MRSFVSLVALVSRSGVAFRKFQQSRLASADHSTPPQTNSSDEGSLRGIDREVFVLEAVGSFAEYSLRPTFSVLTYNLWGYPQSKDKEIRLDADRVRRSMNALTTEVLNRKPAVVAFQEYNSTAFDESLKSFWKWYPNCRIMAQGHVMVRIGVRRDVKCEVVAKDEKFASRLRDCKRRRGARSYQSVKIKVENTWISVAGLHLMSGEEGRQCRTASLEYTFSRISETGMRGIVMGDMNWHGRLSNQDRVVNITHWESFHDAGWDTENGLAVTFPAYEQNPRKPTHWRATRLDRIFYTWNGLKATKLELVNKRIEMGSRVPDIYQYISDHYGLHATFEVCGKRTDDLESIDLCEEAELVPPLWSAATATTTSCSIISQLGSSSIFLNVLLAFSNLWWMQQYEHFLAERLHS